VVGRPHGTAGAVRVSDATERIALLDAGRTVRVGEHDLVIDGRTGSVEHPILKLRGVDDRSSAEAMRGSDITVARDDLGPLEEGEYLTADLVGLAVTTPGGTLVGHVRDVLFLPSVEALEVERPEGGELLVPLVRDAVRSIDPAHGRVEVEPSFLDLEAAPETDR
jgi:16S rRNA processing protein RimM